MYRNLKQRKRLGSCCPKRRNVQSISYSVNPISGITTQCRNLPWDSTALDEWDVFRLAQEQRADEEAETRLRAVKEQRRANMEYNLSQALVKQQRLKACTMSSQRQERAQLREQAMALQQEALESQRQKRGRHDAVQQEMYATARAFKDRALLLLEEKVKEQKAVLQRLSLSEEAETRNQVRRREAHVSMQKANLQLLRAAREQSERQTLQELGKLQGECGMGMQLEGQKKKWQENLVRRAQTIERRERALSSRIVVKSLAEHEREAEEKMKLAQRAQAESLREQEGRALQDQSRRQRTFLQGLHKTAQERQGEEAK